MKKALALLPVVALLATAAPAPAQTTGFCPPTTVCPAPEVGSAPAPVVIQIPKPKALKKKGKKGKKGKKSAGVIVYINPW